MPDPTWEETEPLADANPAFEDTEPMEEKPLQPIRASVEGTDIPPEEMEAAKRRATIRVARGLPPAFDPASTEGKASGRTAIEVGAGAATAPFTGGLGLLARLGVAGATGAGASLLAEPGDPTEGGVIEKVKRAAGTGGRFMLGEGIGSLLAKAGGAVARGLLRPKGPDAAARVAAAQAIEAGGGVLPPAQASGRNVARLFQGAAESSTLGAAPIQAAKEGAEEIATQSIRDFADSLPSRYSREELGSVVQDALEGRTKSFLEAAEDAYGAVDDAFEKAIQGKVAATGAVIPQGTKVTAEPTVSVAGVKQAAAQLLSRAKQGLPGKEIQGILGEILEKPDTMTFRAAQRLRSDLLRVTRTGTELIAGQAKGAAKKLSGLVDDAMEASAKAAGPEVFEAWRRANAGYKKGAELFNSKLVQQLASRQPEAVVDGILKANRPGTVRLAKQAIGDGKIWQSVQREYVERLVTRDAIDAAGEVLSGQKVLTRLRNFGDSASEVLGAERVRALEEMARTLKYTQEFTGKKAGGIAIRGASEAGGLALVLSGSPAGAAIAIAPSAIGYLFSNPTAVRVLTRGFRAPQGSAEAARAFSQLAQIAASKAMGEERKADPTERRLEQRRPGLFGGSATLSGPR